MFLNPAKFFDDKYLPRVMQGAADGDKEVTMDYFESNCNGKYEWIENSSNGKLLKTMFYWKFASGPPPIFECSPYSNENEYSQKPLQLDEGWHIETFWLFFYLKKMITWEKIVVKNGQKRDFDPPYWAY